jgi:hypothetical protein
VDRYRDPAGIRGQTHPESTSRLSCLYGRRWRAAGKATMAVVLVATIGAVVGVRAIHSRARHEPVPEALAAKPAFRATATVHARAFMHTYPSSPYRARIRALVFESE